MDLLIFQGWATDYKSLLPSVLPTNEISFKIKILLEYAFFSFPTNQINSKEFYAQAKTDMLSCCVQNSIILKRVWFEL